MIDVVIVNWNSGVQVHSCVESVLAHGAGLVANIIVVDNGSSDGSGKKLLGLPGVTLIEAGENLGFAKACNLGARQASGEFILFLNPDAAIYESTLPKVFQFMSSAAQERVGICGVQLIDSNGAVARTCSRFPSPARFVMQAVGLDRVFPEFATFMSNWDHKSTRQVDQVMGAFFFVRRHLFNILDGFDERFFVYFEEVDFAYRAKIQSWDTVYLADAQSFHLGGGTSHQVKAKRLFYFLRSKLLFSIKHFSSLHVALVLLMTFIVEPVSRVALSLRHRSWASVKEVASAFGMLFRWFPRWAISRSTR